MQIKDKVVVVTGAGAGIGRALSERFVAEGANAVIATDISPDLESVSAEIGALSLIHI